MSTLRGWIPVSERLPSKDYFGRTGFYFVTCYDDDGALMTKASTWGPVEDIYNLSDTCKKYTYDGWAFGVADLFSAEISYIDFAVAWAEMPDPYTGVIMRKEE